MENTSRATAEHTNTYSSTQPLESKFRVELLSSEISNGQPIQLSWAGGFKVFSPATSGDHVNGVDRNHSKDIIATGDDWGFVNLYRNPALKGAKSLAYRAHSSHVVRVMFDAKD